MPSSNNENSKKIICNLFNHKLARLEAKPKSTFSYEKSDKKNNTTYNEFYLKKNLGNKNFLSEIKEKFSKNAINFNRTNSAMNIDTEKKVILPFKPSCRMPVMYNNFTGLSNKKI